MPIPDYQSIMLPLLQLASDKKEHRVRDATTQLAKKFQMTDEELAALQPSGTDYVFRNRFRWAVLHMKQAGLIQSIQRGWFQITRAGIDLLAENPQKIDQTILKRYQQLTESKNTKQSEDPVSVAEADPKVIDDTPDELIETAYREIRESVQSELLEKIIAGTPAAFERLAIKLLTAMGYGGSFADASSVLGRSHDGGIDGVINVDKLGLDRIYIQAKRWKSASVRSEDVRGFVGALSGKNAQKGVFITTAKFSPDAEKYVNNLNEKKVVLIDGKRLAELMFEYDLGVSAVDTYVVKRVDVDFFDWDEID